MRLLVAALALLAPSGALAQQTPGGPRIFEELDALTSTTSTGTPSVELPSERKPAAKRRGILGINVVNIQGQVRVKSLKPDGAAERAGIQKWDTILAIDGEPVANRRDYVRLMKGKRAGERVMVEWKAGDGTVRNAVIALDPGRAVIAEDAGPRERETAKRRRVPRKRPERTRKWYGWQGLISDIPSLVLVLFTRESLIAGGFGLVGYSIGTPMTHFFHDNVGRGMISMALRVGIPALTVLGTIGICDEARVCDDATPLVVIGALTMFLAIPAIDIAALSWQKLEPRRQTEVKVSVAPAVAPTDGGGATFGLSGTF